ncbi:leukocyte immunoglobulin-like receptor subfamily A member 6 isoform X2 [Macrotis lagotis]|uniref:leukocyte immunoglobulin-like receptor subfamily A member 6 isoform X2 n=1 Tax=Macrotis lagotis TaxID=92651 RepID=UPI003D682372
MAPTLSAQLCLGLVTRKWVLGQEAESNPDPPLQGCVCAGASGHKRGKPVTLWCEGPPGAELYRLWKGGGYEDMEKSADGREAQFLISNMTVQTAGRYQCDCMNQSWWSEASDPLELIITGSYDPPSLSALPSSQVASGQEVTLRCQSEGWYDKSALHRDGEEITYGVAQDNGWGAQTNFSMPAVTLAHGGTYRCYSFHSKFPYMWSAPSDPLVLRVTGSLPRPSLRAEPGLVIPQGKPVTLWCEGPPGADLYHLWKEGVKLNMEKSADAGGAQFLISNMKEETAGRYQCRYMNQSSLSEASDPLELRVSGLHEPPSLLALPSSQVALGQQVTLQCQSDEWYDRSALYKDGEEISYKDQGSQTHFFISAVTPAHGGIYRCYSFHSDYPYIWTAPSDPLMLRVRDAAPLDYTVGNVIRLLLAGLVLIILGILLIKDCTASKGR